MTNKDIQILKIEILHYLCDDFGGNQAIFDRKEGYQVFHNTDLEMVMDKVVKALYVCKDKVDTGYEQGYRQGYNLGYLDGAFELKE